MGLHVAYSKSPGKHRGRRYERTRVIWKRTSRSMRARQRATHLRRPRDSLSILTTPVVLPINSIISSREQIRPSLSASYPPRRPGISPIFARRTRSARGFDAVSSRPSIERREHRRKSLFHSPFRVSFRAPTPVAARRSKIIAPTRAAISR